ncbi:MAG: biotin--[acetyl-CoA-carboxylase] ligase [Lachnospiraceae bacterium]|nr:biotin--[acetyl-CoA-carboxylase] ligase [Lachnospiraceae bacterium]
MKENLLDKGDYQGNRRQEHRDHLSLQELERQIQSRWLGSSLCYYDKIDSTNLEAKRLAASGLPEGTVVVADLQESGRGRLGRNWASPAGCGLWMSMILRPSFLPVQASMVTLVAAMAVMDAIEEVSGVQVQIKWPNDLVAEGRKVCGILTEMSMEENRIRFIICGMGVNVNNDCFPEELEQKAISLSMLTGKKLSRAKLAAAVCRFFEKYYEDFLVRQNLGGIKNAYNARLVNRNQKVVISDGAGSFTCVSEGIDETGALLVRREDGTRQAISSGEVSVRGLYGYV